MIPAPASTVILLRDAPRSGRSSGTTEVFMVLMVDTRFFAARAPESQDALHDQGETIDSLWIAPADAIARADGNSIDLPHPTRHSLQELSGLGDAAAALAWYRARKPPRFVPE